MTEPLRNHDDDGGATAVYVVQAPQWHRAFGVTGALHMRGTHLVGAHVYYPCALFLRKKHHDDTGLAIRH